MSKEKDKYLVKYENAKLLAHIAIGAFGSVSLLILIFSRFSLGGFIGAGIFGAVAMIMGMGIYPKKSQHLPSFKLGTKVYHNPLISRESNDRMYESDDLMDYRKVLPVWEVVYLGEDEYTIECNGQKKKVSYFRQNNLIAVVESSSPDRPLRIKK